MSYLERVYVPQDATAALERELADARSDLTKRADRTEALAELVDRALAYSARTENGLSDLDDLLLDGARRGGEAERARVQSLIERAASAED